MNRPAIIIQFAKYSNRSMLHRESRVIEGAQFAVLPNRLEVIRKGSLKHVMLE